MLSEAEAREALVEAMRRLDSTGLNRGTSGNLSIRLGEQIVVTPSGVPPSRLRPESMVVVDPTGQPLPGQLRPSSEWRMHKGLLDRRPDVGAVVHCHARHATILACAGLPIPAIHYMVGVTGMSSVPVAPYHPFGSDMLAQCVAETVGSGRACLMANHGLTTLASDLDTALLVAEEVEEQAAIYWGTLAIGSSRLLSDEEMGEVLVRFASYGQSR